MAFVFHEYYPSLCYFANNILHDEKLAEDVVQDCFIKLWHKHKEINRPETIKSYLYSMVRNRCVSQLRKKKSKHGHETNLKYMLDECEENVMDQMIRSETMQQIFSALDSLPPQCQKVFKMLYLEGKDCLEVASELQLSVSTIRNHKAKAIILLKQKLVLLFLFLFTLSGLLP